MKTHRTYRWRILDQSLLSLLFTFALIEFTNRGSGIIDGLFVSNFLGANEVAGVGIARTIYPLTGAVSGMLAVAIQSTCSHKLGKGDVKEFNRVFSSLFYISVSISIVLTGILIACAKPIAVMFGASGSGAGLTDIAAEYLVGIGMGLPAILLTPVMSVALQLDSATSLVRVSGIIYFVGDCVLDYVAVKLGMGVMGIAMATSVATSAQFLFLFAHFLKKDRMLKFTKFDSSFKEVIDALGHGTERTLRSLGRVASLAILNRIILLFVGTMAMSAFSIQKDFISFVEIFAGGLANATSLQIGVSYGEVNSEAVRATGKSVHKYCNLFLGGAGVALILFRRIFAGMYISEPGELQNLVIIGAVFTGFYAPLTGLVRSRISYLNAIKRKKSMQILTILSSIVYTPLVAFILGYIFGACGVLATELVQTILLLLTIVIHYQINTKKIIPAVDDYLCLPEEFDLPPGDVISLDILNADDATLAAEQIQLFCKGHGFDNNIAMKAAICFEELATFTIRNGFPRSRGGKPSIDLRVVVAENNLVMRIKDNCPAFNVEAEIAKEKRDMDPEDIRFSLVVLGALAENINYVHSLDTNNVIISFSGKSL